VLTEAPSTAKWTTCAAEGERHHGTPGPGRHRHGVLPPVKIAGEDVVEEPVQEQPLDSIPAMKKRPARSTPAASPKEPPKKRWPSNTSIQWRSLGALNSEPPVVHQGAPAVLLLGHIGNG